MAVASTFPTPKGVSKDVVHAVGSQVQVGLKRYPGSQFDEVFPCSGTPGTSILLYPGTWFALSNGSCPLLLRTHNYINRDIPRPLRIPTSLSAVRVSPMHTRTRLKACLRVCCLRDGWRTSNKRFTSLPTMIPAQSTVTRITHNVAHDL